MEMDKTDSGKKGYLFNLDILIEADHNGAALEHLLQMLNSSRVKDYRIKSGIELGRIIEAALQAASSKEAVRPSVKNDPEARPVPGKKESAAESSDVLRNMNEFIAKNTLFRLTILKGKGVKLSIPCRIIASDSTLQTVTVYHVDEKKVYQFGLNEIDDFIVVG